MRPIRSLLPISLFALALACAGFSIARPAAAGCGCDHPAPDWSLVMPPFGSPRKTVTIYAEGGEFVPGAVYEVDFQGRAAQGVAPSSDRIEVMVPANVAVGPIEIRVSGQGYDFTYPASAFIGLPNPRKIKNKQGVFTARNYDAAVGSDGTLYLPLDVSSVLEPMQFALALLDLPLAYDAEDVAIYNADGFDLTLFALDVLDPTVRQWGSYYGWTVEGDSGLQGVWYKGKTGTLSASPLTSNLFTYWRHEFHSYAAAHAPGGSHEVNEQGYHPDGTLHVDHSQLVIAITGLERDAAAPDDLSLARPLQPGNRTVDVGWASILTDHPVELVEIEPLIYAIDGSQVESLEEVLFQGH